MDSYDDPRQVYRDRGGQPSGPWPEGPPPLPQQQGPPQQMRPTAQLTFGQVFWAVILALMVWSVAWYFLMQALLEEHSSGL